MKEFAERLEAIMDERGIGVKQLAYRMGCHLNTVYSWKKGERFPQIETFAELCRALGVSADYLLGLKGDRK